MKLATRRTRHVAALAAAVLVAAVARPACAYIDLAPTIAKVVGDARTIADVEVVSLDRATGTLTVREARTLKGARGAVPLVQHVAAAESTIIPRSILQWAEPGARAVVFSGARTAIVCLGSAWYQLNLAGKDWKLGADRPELALTYYGTVSRLSTGLEKMLAGGDAVLTMMPHAEGQNASFDLSLNRIAYPGLIRVERLRANLSMPGTVWAVSNSPNYKLGMGPADVEDLPALEKQLEAKDATARASAADEIRELADIVGAAATRGSLPALQKCLGDDAPAVRFNAAAAVLRLTHGDEAAQRVLAAGLTDADAHVRRDAADAAGVAGAAAAPLVPALAKLLGDPDDAVQFAALRAIGTLGPTALEARDAVIPLLNSKSLQGDAADALGRMGPRAQPVPPGLAELLRSDQADVRLAALRGMCQIGGKEAAPAADYIASAIGDANEIDAYNMAELLGLLGPVASSAAARIRTVPMPNPAVLAATNWAMNAPDKIPWTDGSTEVVGDLGDAVWAAYISALGERLRPCALALAPRLITATAGVVPEWGYKILNAAPAESLAVVAPHLLDADKVLRERAAVIVGHMGPPAESAKAKLEVAIKRAPDEQEKNLMAWALREITKD